MATSEPDAAMALGAYLGLKSNTFWFERTASTLSTSAMKTVESPPTATPALGCAAVENEAGLFRTISTPFSAMTGRRGQAYV